MIKLIPSSLTFLLLFSAAAASSTLDWPGLYDTDSMPGLNIKMRQQDWDIILLDESYDIEVPALFWADEDGSTPPILVSIRRKSATPINGKVSLKIDINEYDGADPRATGLWHGVKKLSLENGDDVDMVSEGIAWGVHRQSVESGLYPEGHKPGLANLVTLTVQLTSGCQLETCGQFDLGEIASVLDPMVYLNVEQNDKSFLKNRGLWVSNETWLYKQDSPSELPEVKEAGCTDERISSPILSALQCAPFIVGSEGGTTRGSGRKEEPSITVCDMALVDSLVDMEMLLTQGAIGAFTANRDDVLGHEKNFYMVDRSAEGNCEQIDPTDPPNRKKRLHFPWDLDSSLATIDRSVYGSIRGKRLDQTGYQRLLLEDYPESGLLFRTFYNKKLLALTDPGFMASLFKILDDFETHAGAALEADDRSKISNAASHIQGVKKYLTERALIVRAEVCADDPSLDGC